MSAREFERLAGDDEGLFGPHLRRILFSLKQNSQLLDAVRAMLKDRPCPSADDFYRLRAGGVLAGDSPRDARLRCGLYKAYLSSHLL